MVGELTDGHSPSNNLTNLNALKQCAEAKILSIKEEGARPRKIKHMISTLPRVTNIINGAH